MSITPAPSPAELKRQAQRLMKAAEMALSPPLTAIHAFKDASAFKAGMIKSLGLHPDFDRAVRDLHGLHALAQAHGASQVPASVRPSGRVQASRYDPSQGQRDRQRGQRSSGGKRQGARSNKRLPS
jgi:hypothetical protein